LVLPITALKQLFDWAAILTVIIVIECGVLALNHGRCPVTNLAARFTADRADDFDIFLPLWLARYNKSIFGTLFVINEAFVLCCWVAAVDCEAGDPHYRLPVLHSLPAYSCALAVLPSRRLALRRAAVVGAIHPTEDRHRPRQRHPDESRPFSATRRF
jgi:hypothetical protein